MSSIIVSRTKLDRPPDSVEASVASAVGSDGFIVWFSPVPKDELYIEVEYHREQGSILLVDVYIPHDSEKDTTRFEL